MTNSFKKFYVNKKEYIAYKDQIYHKNKKSIIWFGGLYSDMDGTKANYLSKFARKNEINFCRFDYFGHGKSSKEFQDCTISHWLDNGKKMVDNIFQGPLILIGSSMGGWISLLTSLKRKKRVKNLILIAPAIDMTEKLMWKNFSPKEKQMFKKNGFLQRFSEGYDEGYKITKNLLNDGSKYSILDNKINLNIPIKIFHGMKDDSVPWRHSLDLISSLSSERIDINFIKDGDHSLSRENDLKNLGNNILEYLN